MLKNIRLHLESSEEKQDQLEADLARLMSEIRPDNLNALQRSIPSLLPFTDSKISKNYSVFCNKNGEQNIIDYGQGRTFYGLQPKQEIAQHLEDFYRYPCFISLDKDNANGKINSQTTATESTTDSGLAIDRKAKRAALPESFDCLVVMGLGLGEHILRLVQERNIKHLIIYEPEIQFFTVSVNVTNWKAIIETASAKNTGLYVQLGKDSRDLIQEVSELNEHFPIDGFYLYKHYNHVIFDKVYQQVQSVAWKQLTEQGLRFDTKQSVYEYVPPWTTVSQTTRYNVVEKDDQRFCDNLAALQKYFPAIAKEFKNYSPVNWCPMKNQDGQINVVQKNGESFWYGDAPREECLLNFEEFAKHPYKDGLILEYTGKKLLHYLHYQFIKETDQFIAEITDEDNELPENIKSIILFGVGVGYQLEHLAESYSLEKVFICEPNRDFFYASLFAIDWGKVFRKLDNSTSRLYLNIGDDGSHIVKDLMNQFYTVGPYLLNNTYFYPGYYNSSLNEAIANLREQLKIVVAMGEYYDHAFYGINHTVEAIRNKHAHLSIKPSTKLSRDERSVPVFLVGNGPSLDMSIETLKEYQHQSIIISCGTSLQVLYRNGIQPDFHAEIEQNRTTFEWCNCIHDRAFLKKISLLSCNGIHPDTTELFGDVYVAFKEGESSTVSTLEIIGQNKFEVLQFAFPTVTNFALNVSFSLGMENIYLIGVDLGFADNKRHHSIQSAYYKEDGSEAYDYHKENNSAIPVPGNFRKTVFTKYEFKLSKSMMEQSILNKSKESQVFNCSDGARIFGAEPLSLDNILIMSGEQERNSALSSIKNKAFIRLDEQEFSASYQAKYKPGELISDLKNFQSSIAKPATTIKQANSIIEGQKEQLFRSYKKGHSLMFYYIFGTSNYANAVLSRMLFSAANEETCLERFNGVLSLWSKYMNTIIAETTSSDSALDATSSLQWPQVWNSLFPQNLSNVVITVVTNSSLFAESIKYYIERIIVLGCWTAKKVNLVSFENAMAQQSNDSDYVIYLKDPAYSDMGVYEQFFQTDSLPLRGTKGTYIGINNRQDYTKIRSHQFTNEKTTGLIMIHDEHMHKQLNEKVLLGYAALRCLSESSSNMLVFPKYKLSEEVMDAHHDSIFTPFENPNVTYWDFNEYLAISDDTRAVNQLNFYGIRGKKLYNPKLDDLVFEAAKQEKVQLWIDNFAEEISHLFADEEYSGSQEIVW